MSETSEPVGTARSAALPVTLVRGGIAEAVSVLEADGLEVSP